MAAPANTVTTATSVGNREDLVDWIRLVSPEDTPFYSFIAETTATAINHEWQTQALRTPTDTNAKAEGDTFTPTAAKPTVRLGNYTQILDDVAFVSRTQEVVSKAGRSSQIRYEMLRRGTSLKQDLEMSLLAAKAKVGASPRVLGGLPAYCSAATYVGGTGTPTAPTGDGTTAPTAGTAGALTMARVTSVLQAMWTQGAQPKYAMWSVNSKLAFDQLAATGNLGYSQITPQAGSQSGPGFSPSTGAKYLTTVTIWQSSFGEIEMSMNRWTSMPLIVLDGRSEYQPRLAPLPKSNFISPDTNFNADGESRALLFEGTLEVPAPNAIGVLNGVTGG